ncbi:choice-of-anchor D domain-containing protein [Oryzihumus sp.]|uniref:choice-of-anchor D domain-containing protein n=1 Tax=Oryzihumus sp. TaxID=1968903 RepID=UPI002EDAAB2D
MKTPLSILAKLASLAVVLCWTPQASAYSTYYTNGAGSNLACTTCHSSTVTTCNGCHSHGTHPDSTKSSINISASTDKTTYQPGQTVTVTVNGGYRTGWVRVNLYDGNMALLTSSCPSGPTSCYSSTFPATLTAAAPMTPGTYTWRASWYGNAYDASGAYFSSACGSPAVPPCFRQDPNNNTAGAVHGEEIVAVTQFTVVSAAAPSIALSPTSLSFGTVTVGGTVSQPVQVRNTGTAPLNVSSIALTGASTAFTWSPAAPFTVAAGGTTTVTVSYTPAAAGAASATLVFTSDDPANPTVSLALSGTGQAATTPSISVTPTSLAFGNVVVGASGTQTFTISNTGTATLSGTAALAAGTNNEFSVSPATFSIAAGGQPVTVTVSYAPSGAGTDTGAVSVASNDSAHPAVSVTITGAGVASPAPTIALAPATLAFGNVVTGATATLTTQVRNTGTLALVVSAIDRCAGTSAEFAWSKSVSFTVDPGASVPVDVTYAPTGLGGDSGCIAFTSNDPTTAVADLAVSGAGVAQPIPIAAVSPTSLDFGAVTIGSAASRTVTIQNTGTGALNVTGISLSSGTSSAFSWSPAAPFAVAAGTSATLTVTYKPTDGAAASGAIVIASDDPASPTISVALTGSGAQPTHSSGGCSGSGGSAGWLVLAALALLMAGRRSRGRRVQG